MSQFSIKAAENLEKIRSYKPLVHNITNFVVMNFTANVLLASGAAPVMAHAVNEVEEMVGLAGALVLNIGTLTDDWVEAMVRAGRRATELGKPVILDPVGAGATALRTNAAKRLLKETAVSVVRGNASEVLALQNAEVKTRGVDTLHGVDEAAESAARLAGELESVVTITGAVDLVTDGERVLRIANGHPLMGMVTGTGCAATALIGAFAAVDNDPLTAAASALAYYGLAGQRAAEISMGPGSFMINLLDALFNLTLDEVYSESKITYEKISS